MQANVKGTTLPVLEITLNPGEGVISTHGELSWMTPNIAVNQTMNAGGQQHGFMAGVKRVLSGGGLFQTQYFAQQGGGPGMIAFSTKVPGQILPVPINPQNPMVTHRHGFLCGTHGISVTATPIAGFDMALFGHEGLIMQRIEGQGEAWIELSGEVATYNLAPGQTLLVHPGHIGLYQQSVSLQVTRMRGVRNMLFGNNGMVLVAMTGPGEVWLQSMPIQILANTLYPYMPHPTGGTTNHSGGPEIKLNLFG